MPPVLTRASVVGEQRSRELSTRPTRNMRGASLVPSANKEVADDKATRQRHQCLRRTREEELLTQ